MSITREGTCPQAAIDYAEVLRQGEAVIGDCAIRLQDHTSPAASDLDLSDLVTSFLAVASILLIPIGLVLGATFVGADASSGALAGQAVFEPRRAVLVIGKVASASALSGIGALVLMTVGMFGLSGVGAIRGVVATDALPVGSNLFNVLRVAAAVTAVVACGAAGAFLVRRTVPVIIFAFVVLQISGISSVVPWLGAIVLSLPPMPHLISALPEESLMGAPDPGWALGVATIWAVLLTLGAWGSARWVEIR